MKPEIENLIRLAVADGKITEKERSIIISKAKKLGEDIDKVEFLLNGELALLKNENLSKSQSHIGPNNTELVNINFFHAAMLYLNRHKILKYALIFFLICLGFNLLTLVMVI